MPSEPRFKDQLSPTRNQEAKSSWQHENAAQLMLKSLVSLACATPLLCVDVVE
jgi:hypothetical protein